MKGTTSKAKIMDEKIAEYKAKLEKEEADKRARKAEETGEFWSKVTPITMLAPAGAKIATKIALCEKDGKTYVDIRKFVNAKGKENDYSVPTGKGISIELSKQEDLVPYIAGMQKAGSMMRKVVGK